MLNAVRLKKPIKLSDFSFKTGINTETLKNKLIYAEKMKWIKYEGESLILSSKGYLLSDEIVKLTL